MNIVVLSCDPQFNLNLTEVLAPYRIFPKLNVKLVNVVEPSLVVDMSLSITGGRSFFRHILDQRFSFAEQSVLMAQSILSSYASMNVSAEALHGDPNLIAINAAIEHGADLLIVDSSNISAGRLNKLLKNCPCPITLINSKTRRSA